MRLTIVPNYKFLMGIAKNQWNTLAFIPSKDVLIVGTIMPKYLGEN